MGRPSFLPLFRVRLHRALQAHICTMNKVRLPVIRAFTRDHTYATFMSCTSVLPSSRCGSDIELNQDKHVNSAESYAGVFLPFTTCQTLTDGVLSSEQPLEASFIYDGHGRPNRHGPSAFNPSATLSSLLEAQVPPLLPGLPTDEDPTSDDSPLIYGFPAHWFGVTSSDANPVITITAPESYSSVETISSPKPTPFGIDSSWMSCSEASTGYGSPSLRYSTSSSWLDNDEKFFPRPLREVTPGRSRIIWKGIGREVDADCLRAGF